MRQRLFLFFNVLGVASLVACADGALRASSTHEEVVAPATDPKLGEERTTNADELPFAFVVDADGTPYVVLSNLGGLDGEELATDDAWATSEPELLAEGNVFVARRTVALDRLPVRARQLVGERLRLFDARGARCTAIVDELSLLVRADPRYEQRLDWEGELEGARHPKTPASQIAGELWTMSGSTLVAHVRSVEGACTGATWARSASLSLPHTAEATVADAALTRRALDVVRTFPSYATTQKAYETDGEEPRAARWESASSVTTSVSSMIGAEGARYVWVAIAGGEGCGGFNGGVVALLREDPSAPFGLRVVHGVDDGAAGAPRGVIDQGGGRPTLLFDAGALRFDGDGYRFDSIAVSSMDCPC